MSERGTTDLFNFSVFEHDQLSAKIWVDKEHYLESIREHVAAGNPVEALLLICAYTPPPRELRQVMFQIATEVWWMYREGDRETATDLKVAAYSFFSPWATLAELRILEMFTRFLYAEPFVDELERIEHARRKGGRYAGRKKKTGRDAWWAARRARFGHLLASGMDPKTARQEVQNEVLREGLALPEKEFPHPKTWRRRLPDPKRDSS